MTYNPVAEEKPNKDQASGYTGLDPTTKVLTDKLGAGTADATTFLRGDRTWAAPGGGGGAASPGGGYSEDGVDGEPGPPGRAGVDGQAGATGAPGPEGPAIFLLNESEDGEPGPPGRSGVDGQAGATGAPGPAGPAIFLLDESEDGEPGAPGVAGPAGPAGGSGITKAAGASIAAGSDITWLVLAVNSSDITGTTLTTVMTVTGVGPGRYRLKVVLIYQATATTTGMQVAVNHTGTLTQYLMEKRVSTTGTTVVTAAATEAGVGAAGNLYESQGQRTKNTIIGSVTVSVDAANNDMLVVIEGFFVVSVSGDLEIKLAAELAALVVRAMQGSSLELHKLS
jgi:hypothetical protein